jgi:uncharacterized RDD family membrane protein YckC
MYGVTPGYYPPGYTYGGRPRYAGWWQRVGATLLDSLISWIFLLPGFIVAMAGPKTTERCTLNGRDRLCEVPTDGALALTIILYVVGFVTYLVIYVRMLGRGATWGRKAAGYRILDERTMQPIGSGRAIGRYFAAILSALPCYLGFLWPLWDSENRTFHDMIVKTRAIKNG